MTVDQLARKLVEKSKTASCDYFGDWCKQVDHKILGGFLKETRLKKSVMAMLVAEEIGVTKTQLNFLEGGKKKWNKEILCDYIRAVNRISKET